MKRAAEDERERKRAKLDGSDGANGHGKEAAQRDTVSVPSTIILVKAEP